MERWKCVVAAAVATVVVAGPVLAQTSTPPAGDKGTSSTGATTSEGAKTDKSESGMKSGGKAGRTARGTQGREQVKMAQQALKDKGHDPGSIDGVMGAKTKAALKEFQKAQGLPETGRLDSETMTKLGTEAKTGAASGGTPSASPGTSEKPSGEKKSE